MIKRTTNQSPFAMIKIDVLRSGMLTADEIGLYTLMMSRTDNWEFSEFVLARELHTNPSEVRQLLKRLEQKGFTRERKGKYGPVWDLFELSDQLPQRRYKTCGDYTVPQDVAEAFVDRFMLQGKREPQKRIEEDHDAAAPQKATNEEMAQKFFEKAEELRKVAAEQRLKRDACRTGINRV